MSDCEYLNRVNRRECKMCIPVKKLEVDYKVEKGKKDKMNNFIAQREQKT